MTWPHFYSRTQVFFSCGAQQVWIMEETPDTYVLGFSCCSCCFTQKESEKQSCFFDLPSHALIIPHSHLPSSPAGLFLHFCL